MAAVSELLRFYVDESALGLGKTMAAARKDTIHCGHPLAPRCPLGIKDPQWIPIVAEMGLVAIGRDKHLRTREAEFGLVETSCLRVFRIAAKRDLSTWDWLKVVMRNWDAMERIVAENPDGPWYYAISVSGPPKRLDLGQTSRRAAVSTDKG